MSDPQFKVDQLVTVTPHHTQLDRYSGPGVVVEVQIDSQGAPQYLVSFTWVEVWFPGSRLVRRLA